MYELILVSDFTKNMSRGLSSLSYIEQSVKALKQDELEHMGNQEELGKLEQEWRDEMEREFCV